MKRNFTILHIFIIFILYIFLFSICGNYVFADTFTNNQGDTYTYTPIPEGELDDGTDGPDVENLRFQLTVYGSNGEGTLNGTPASEFKYKNEKHGWNEMELNGVRYAIFAGATHWMFKYGGGKHWFYHAKFDHIHYFKTWDSMPAENCEKIQFKFEDTNYDTEVYNGIILDTGDAMMFPGANEWSPGFYEKNVNALDIYYTGVDSGQSNSQASGPDGVNGKIVKITMNGSFSSNSTNSTDSSDSSDKELTLGEKIMNFIAEKFFVLIGDIIQILLDKAGTNLTEKEAENVLYPSKDLENPKAQYLKDIQLSASGTTNKDSTDTKALKSVQIESTSTNRHGKKVEVFNKDAQIPVIPIDIFSISTTNIDLFDIDFLSSNSNNTNKIWNIYRDLVSGISHVILYFCTALIIVMLIWRSILLVIASNYEDSLKTVERSKKIMDDLVQAVIYIVVIYLIIAIINNLYKVTISFITSNATNYPIRLNVNGLYSFNTNLVGWVRYKTQTLNIGSKFGHSFLYFITAIFDGIWFIAMFIRNFLLGIVVIIAPITAITKLLGDDTKKNIFHFNEWIKFYLVVLWIPIIVVIITSLLLRL